MFKEAYWTQTHYLALSRPKGQNSEKLCLMMLKEALPPSVKCSMCSSDLQQCVRCMDCGPCFFVCSKCDMNIHNSHPMHDQEFWNGEFFQSLLPTEAIDSQGKLFPLSKYSVP